jgi:hypothetical protein
MVGDSIARTQWAVLCRLTRHFITLVKLASFFLSAGAGLAIRAFLASIFFPGTGYPIFLKRRFLLYTKMSWLLKRNFVSGDFMAKTRRPETTLPIYPRLLTFWHGL